MASMTNATARGIHQHGVACILHIVVTAICAAPAGCVIEPPAPLLHETTTHSASSAHDAGSDHHAAASNDAGAGATDNAAPSAELDDTTVLAAIAHQGYSTSQAFTRVSLAPYPSTAAPGSYIASWVSSDAYEAYTKVDPSTTGSHVQMPVGTTIVRAVLNADDKVTKLTLMVKGPAGYNPALGDWWFGVTDPSGAPLENDAGAEVGRMSACFSCHIPRAKDDFLFGVPSSDRAAHP
jgi:hypothetical protein